MKVVAVLFALALACVSSMHAQGVQGAGSITGQIRDFANQGIPGTTVIVTNDAYDVRREMFTTDDGLFDAPQLTPGPGYAIKITRKGFKEIDVKDVEVVLGRILNYRITMEQDNATRPVKAGAQQAQVDDTRQGVSDVTVQVQVEALPSKDRRVDTLAALSPAVTQSPVTGILFPYASPLTSSVLVDGISTTRTHWVVQPRLAPEVPLDAVSETQVLTTALPSEFAHTMGAAVDVVTKVGSGHLHGSLYDYFRDNSLRAPIRFAPQFHPSEHQHQAGADAGQAILGNTMFWFGSFEAIDGSSQGLNLLTNPLLTNSAGTAISTVGCAATAAQCNAAANFLNAQLNKVVTRTLSSYNGIGKLDYHLTEDQTFNVEAGAMHRNSPDGSDMSTVSTNSGLLGNNGSYTEETRFGKAGWNSQWGGRANNNIYVSWFRDRFSDYADPNLLPVTGALGINVAGTPFGGNPNYPMAVSQQNRSVTDAFQISAGSHTIRLGVEYVRGEDWTDQVYDRSGTYNYPSLTAFAMDFSGNAALHKNYTTYTQQFGNPVVDLRTAQYSGFAQDTWKITSRLTVTAGLHYERIRLPKPTLTSPVFYQTASISSPDKDAGPRAGISYLLNDKTVVRAAVGEYYQPYTGQLLDSLFLGNGLYQPSLTLNASQTGAGAPVYPKILPVINIPAGGQNVVYGVGRMRNPYAQQGTLAIERAITRNTTVTLSYLYTHGKALFTATDTNLNPSTVSQTYTVDNANGTVNSTFTTPLWTSRVNPNFSHVYEVENGGSSRYNGASVQIRQHMSHGLAAELTYTWSDATGNTNGPVIPQLGFAVPATTYTGDNGSDQGHSPFEQRNRAVLNWTWQPGIAKSSSWLMRAVLNGWQLNGVATMATGMRQTPLVAVTGQQFSGVTMSYLNSLDGSGGWARVPFMGISSLRTDNERLVNARLSRSISFTERFKGTFMFEMFNVLNSQYATSVNAVAYTAQNGVLKPVPGLGIGNAADGYPFGDNARRAQFALKISF